MTTCKMFVYMMILSGFVAYAAGDISENCLNCICQVEGCQNEIGRCSWDVYSDSCGPFQIKIDYWKESGAPGEDWQTCTKQMACSKTSVRGYMKRYAQRCTGSRAPTCQDYARIHKGGPNGCKYSSTLGYWRKVQSCCASTGGC